MRVTVCAARRSALKFRNQTNEDGLDTVLRNISGHPLPKYCEIRCPPRQGLLDFEIWHSSALQVVKRSHSMVQRENPLRRVQPVNTSLSIVKPWKASNKLRRENEYDAVLKVISVFTGFSLRFWCGMLLKKNEEDPTPFVN